MVSSTKGFPLTICSQNIISSWKTNTLEGPSPSSSKWVLERFVLLLHNFFQHIIQHLDSYKVDVTKLKKTCWYKNQSRRGGKCNLRFQLNSVSWKFEVEENEIVAASLWNIHDPATFWEIHFMLISGRKTFDSITLLKYNKRQSFKCKSQLILKTSFDPDIIVIILGKASA